MYCGVEWDKALHMPSHTTSHTATVSVVRRGRAWKSVMLTHRVHQDVRSPHLRHSSAENNRAHSTSDPQGGEVQSASIRPHLTDGRLSELFAFAWSGDRLLSALSGPPVCFTVAAAQYQIAAIGQASLDWFDVCVATGSSDT